MKQQQGAALAIVMALLAGALMLGMSGLQSALIDERLAGNYRASTQARMNAEIAAASALEDDDLVFITSDLKLNDLQTMGWNELNEEFSNSQDEVIYECERNGLPECVYIPLILSEGIYILAKGITGDALRGAAESQAILLRYSSGADIQKPFRSAITSCQDITLQGSARSSGGLVAGNKIEIKGGASASSDQQEGYSFSEGCDILGVLADDEKERTYFERVKSGLNVEGAAEWLEQRGLNYYFNENDTTFTFTGGQNDQDASISYLGETGRETSLRIDRNLKTSGSLHRLVVDGTLNLFVDGDFDLGDNTALEISKGAVLNLYVSGKVTLSAGSKLALEAEDFMRQDSNGVERPAVSIYSSYRQTGNQSGITIGGSNNTYAAIYAPGADANIGGSGAIYGALRAQNVVMSGAGSLEYVDDLASYEVSGDTQGVGQPSFAEWTEGQ
ncbi:hypothetical protein [Halovibrio sp. HP20-50]|uniref:pilus assembly PilX family protein n=1 Tax=Halovibrio sp. HP20-59 TaxID=3080275 RepID=UPI00294AE0EA|nr:hypothetical protein [Halovibrio sp. HP20-59]MEA2120277.1 hypothetical protein [Halovibrio sp. HP20-59]